MTQKIHDFTATVEWLVHPLQDGYLLESRVNGVRVGAPRACRTIPEADAIVTYENAAFKDAFKRALRDVVRESLDVHYD